MKKNVLKLASFAAGLCVAMTLTSCHNGEDYQEQTTVVNNVVQLESRTLIVRTNVAATVKVGSETKTSTPNTDLEFANPAAAGTIQISATGRQAKSIKYNFKDGAMLYYDVMLESAGQVFSQTDVETNGATVTNGDDNKNDNDGVEASFSLGSETNDGTTGDYSITVFTPTEVETDIEEVKKNEQIEEPVLALDCRPDGAVFENPITVNVNIPESDGFDLGCFDENGNETTSAHTGDKLQIQLTHFSIWDIILKAKLVNDPTVDVVENVYTADASKGSIAYTFKFGFDNNAKSPLIVKYLKKLFGISARDAKKTVTFKKVEGTAKLTVKQQVTTYNFESGSQKFSVTVYGKVTENLSIEAAPEVVPVIPTHGGGSND